MILHRGYRHTTSSLDQGGLTVHILICRYLWLVLFILLVNLSSKRLAPLPLLLYYLVKIFPGHFFVRLVLPWDRPTIWVIQRYVWSDLTRVHARVISLWRIVLGVMQVLDEFAIASIELINLVSDTLAFVVPVCCIICVREYFWLGSFGWGRSHWSQFLNRSCSIVFIWGRSRRFLAISQTLELAELSVTRWVILIIYRLKRNTLNRF